MYIYIYVERERERLFVVESNRTVSIHVYLLFCLPAAYICGIEWPNTPFTMVVAIACRNDACR